MAPALPAELIRRILELVERCTVLRKLELVKCSERLTLCYAAIVSRSWRQEAQAVLWSRVYLETADRAQAFIDSPATQRWLAQGVRKVHVLSIDVSKKPTIDAGLAEQVLDVCPGVQAVTLFRVKKQTGSLLYHPSLYDLKKLYIHLDPKWTARKMAEIPTIAPYKLDVALLSSDKFTPGVEIIRPLFLASQTTLTKLSIIVNSTTTPIWQALLPAVSANIKVLAVMVAAPIMPAAFAPLLSAFTSLEVFYFQDIGCDTQHLIRLLRSLPQITQIKTLRLDAKNRLDGPVILGALRQPAASALETLVMFGGTSTGAKRTPQAVLNECGRRSITHVLVEDRTPLENLTL